MNDFECTTHCQTHHRMHTSSILKMESRETMHVFQSAAAIGAMEHPLRNALAVISLSTPCVFVTRPLVIPGTIRPSKRRSSSSDKPCNHCGEYSTFRVSHCPAAASAQEPAAKDFYSAIQPVAQMILTPYTVSDKQESNQDPETGPAVVFPIIERELSRIVTSDKHAPTTAHPVPILYRRAHSDTSRTWSIVPPAFKD
jgi:hypothetical protein